MNPEEYFDEL